ncbi:MAG: arylamine N-acetyltransferase [Lentimicrobiaceae bacterium]|jgi:N-hydroxyarylamine O-acetyltransferase|nr:arylamine N-acetyltransferase [Lentimicrobiaceae bacterium]MDD4597389.1 arylamine N-acetyltransferase [Lentimicrobiaceae bacterium]MDY0025948.1 arylamine N-acetyltransferase [Lentimicrobium sp.]HAH57410.1 N-hydroxyarylamine O-acetyltransferase [Bacteroidales bacterium]
MSGFTFNKEEYLNRINFDGKVSINFECLKSIHHAQHTTIPFENFDICLGRNINVDPESLVHKMVRNKRGGYCSELNGLLLLALKSFGFEARPLLGRVHITGEPTGRGHQVTLVTIDEKRWLVDLGFGAGSPPVPIPLVCNVPVMFENQTYRLIEIELFGYMLQRMNDEDWRSLYSFDLSHVCRGDIEYGKHYTSTSPESIFVNSRVAALPVKNGMITLFNNSLKKIINGKEEVMLLKDDSSYLSIIEKEFGIEIDAKFEDLRPLK